MQGGGILGPSKIIVADSVDSSRALISELLTKKGYIVYPTQDAAGTLRVSRNILPELVIMDVALQGANAYDTARILEDDKITTVLFITANPNKLLMDRLERMNLYAYLTKPVNPLQLIQLVEFSIMNTGKIKNLSQKIEELETTLESRKIIERAKAILIHRLSITEEEAYRRMRKKSMDACMPMEILAKKILAKYK